MITAVPQYFKVPICRHISQVVELWILDVLALGNKASMGGGASGGESCWLSPGKGGGENPCHLLSRFALVLSCVISQAHKCMRRARSLALLNNTNGLSTCGLSLEVVGRICAFLPVPLFQHRNEQLADLC